ncbi:hypothetical protein [Deinococcus radiophilus]|uniref:Uncharacterized protein n=1 Tax=Deinococcus radiophilus TaxID=32062 RepID=A0A431W365_9DEIO|nr:hypothetical protein [Deinococcus radiophilus]RTR29899.1 hypothetical protein EJ104_02855 [Deinococcus radiophilus]UFA49748.1 hypothetical protein LMT64_07555 [Deinococcus radiophilus]
MTNTEDLKNSSGFNSSSQDAAEGERQEDRSEQDVPQVTSQAPAEGSRDAVEDTATPGDDQE